jgi:hypothetical protein
VISMAEQFGVTELDRAGSAGDTAALLMRLAERLRYRGPFLSQAELDQLRTERGPDAERALTWHELVQRFMNDRPLPSDFAQGPLLWQLDTLAWSLHVDPAPKASAAEMPEALVRELAVEGPLGQNPLSVRYPALAAYAHFLGKLPRK